LWQAWCPLDEIWRCNRADFLTNPITQLDTELVGRGFACHQGDVAINALPLDVVREPDNSRLRYLRMGNQRAFHFGSAEAVTGDVEYVVHATGDPIVAIFVATAAVASEVIALIGFKVGRDE